MPGSPVPHAVPPSPAGVIAAVLLYTTVLAAWVFSPAFPIQLLRNVQDASGGWINATLLLAALLGAGQLALLFGPGRQRPGDLGWRWTALPAACAATLAMWLAMNAATAVSARIDGVALAWQAGWSRGGLLPGALIAQLLGTALLEETVFRAWLWPQLALRFMRGTGTRRAWLLALLASQGLFALLHVPARLAAGGGVGEIAMAACGLFLVGVVFALFYAATRNLFFVVGLHALGNAPTLLAEPHGPPPTLVMLATATAIAAGCWWLRRRQRAPVPATDTTLPDGAAS